RDRIHGRPRHRNGQEAARTVAAVRTRAGRGGPYQGPVGCTLEKGLKSGRPSGATRASALSSEDKEERKWPIPIRFSITTTTPGTSARSISRTRRLGPAWWARLNAAT